MSTLRSDQLNSLVMVANGHDGPVLWGAWLSAEGFLQAASQRNGHWMLTTRGEQVVADYLNGDDPTKADASQSNGSKQAPADGDNK